MDVRSNLDSLNLLILKIKEERRIIFILIIALILRLLYWRFSPLSGIESQLYKVWPDEGTYFSVVRYILDNGYVSFLKSENSVILAPGNPTYIALLYFYSGSINLIRFLNILLSVTSIFIIYRIGSELYNKKAGFFAAAFCSLNSQLVAYSPTILTEPLFLLTISIVMLIIIKTIKKGEFSKGNLLLAVSMFLIAIFTRSILILFPFLLLAFVVCIFIYNYYTKREIVMFNTLKYLFYFSTIPIIFISLVIIKNIYYFEKPIVATGAGAALWLGSRSDTEGDEPPYRKLQYDTEKITNGHSHISIIGDNLLLQAAKKNIAENTTKYMCFSIKKIGRLLIGSNLAWFHPYTNLSDWYKNTGSSKFGLLNMLFQITLSCLVVFLGALGLIKSYKDKIVQLTITISILYFIVFSLPFLVIQRYGLPIFILLSVPAGGVFSSSFMFDNLKSKNLLLLISGMSFFMFVFISILIGI